MAILDDTNNSVVVRIAYAGPAMSGKTESVRSLASALVGKDRSDKKIYSPSEAQGRTMYFDWMDYTAGLFQGRQVRCQIIAVPGQQSLMERRRLILHSADAIIFVLDSSPDRLEEGIKSFREIEPWITKGDTDHPPAGVLIQANKRDLENAIPMETIKQRINADENTGFIETVAPRGLGIREAFVIGVGMALDRTLALMNQGLLEKGAPEIENGEDLLQQMVEQEQTIEKNTANTAVNNEAEAEPGPSGAELGQILHHMLNPTDDLPDNLNKTLHPAVQEIEITAPDPTTDEESQPNVAESDMEEMIDLYATDTHKISMPNIQVPAGLVWPPVTGRVLLNELNNVKPASTKEEDGGWIIECTNGYQLRTESTDQFEVLEQGRGQLLAQVNRHMKLQDVLSLRRCLALAESEDRSWCLWQIIDHQSSLEMDLKSALNESNPEDISTKTFDVAMSLLQALVDFANKDTPLRATLSTTAYSSNRLVYTGFVPPAPAEPVKSKAWPFSRPPLKMVEDEMRPIIAEALARETINVPPVLRCFEQHAAADQKGHNITEMLSFLFLGH